MRALVGDIRAVTYYVRQLRRKSREEANRIRDVPSFGKAQIASYALPALHLVEGTLGPDPGS
jgi:hypothetical protein